MKTNVTFTEREYGLIRACVEYAKNDPCGLPGHTLMIIISKFDQIMIDKNISLGNDQDD